MTHTLTRACPADREPMVCRVLVDEALDPRCYATVGIEPRTRALLTAVPYGGALLREGRSSRRQRLFWAVTLRAVEGAAAGLHAELRLWPESNPAWFQGRLAVLCDSDLETIDALSLDEQRALLERNLASARTRRSSRRPPTGSPTWPTSRARASAAELPPDLPEPPLARRVPPPADVPGAPLPHPRVHARRGRRGAGGPVRAAARPPARSRWTSRPIAGLWARPTTGRRPTERCACCRWRRAAGARSCAASSIATRSRPSRS